MEYVGEMSSTSFTSMSSMPPKSQLSIDELNADIFGWKIDYGIHHLLWMMLLFSGRTKYLYQHVFIFL